MDSGAFILGMGISNLGCLQSGDLGDAFVPLPTSTSKVSAPEFPMSRYITKQRDINAMGLEQNAARLCSREVSVGRRRLVG